MDLEFHQFDQRYGRCGGLAAIRLDRWRVGAPQFGREVSVI